MKAAFAVAAASEIVDMMDHSSVESGEEMKMKINTILTWLLMSYVEDTEQYPDFGSTTSIPPMQHVPHFKQCHHYILVHNMWFNVVHLRFM